MKAEVLFLVALNQISGRRSRRHREARPQIKVGVVKQGTTICLQPLSMSPAGTKLREQTVQERGWRLSVKFHELLALR